MRIPQEARALSKLASKAASAVGNTVGAAASHQINTTVPGASVAAHSSVASASGSAIRRPNAGGAIRTMLTVLDKPGDLPQGTVQLGYHGTTKASLDDIAKHGYDLSRGGTVSGKGLGPGMYGSLSREVASFYANRAADLHLCSSMQEEKTPTLMSVHTLPSEQQVAKTLPGGTKVGDARAAIEAEPKPHHAVQQKADGNHEFVITPKGLSDPDVQYFAVPETIEPDAMNAMRRHRGAFADDKGKQ